MRPTEFPGRFSQVSVCNITEPTLLLPLASQSSTLSCKLLLIESSWVVSGVAVLLAQKLLSPATPLPRTLKICSWGLRDPREEITGAQMQRQRREVLLRKQDSICAALDRILWFIHWSADIQVIVSGGLGFPFMNQGSQEQALNKFTKQNPKKLCLNK